MATETVTRAFTDTRVFVVGINDPRTHCMHPHDYLGMVQDCDGPRYVIVGPHVPNEKLERNILELSSRYGVTLAQLQTVRDLQTKADKAQAD